MISDVPTFMSFDRFVILEICEWMPYSFSRKYFMLIGSKTNWGCGLCQKNVLLYDN